MSIEIEKFADDWGPEKILHVYDPKIGMKGVLVIGNTTLGPGKRRNQNATNPHNGGNLPLARTMTWKCAPCRIALEEA